jgi:hypothetical protein
MLLYGYVIHNYVLNSNEGLTDRAQMGKTEESKAELDRNKEENKWDK